MTATMISEECTFDGFTFHAVSKDDLLAAFDPTVPGMRGDGTPIVLHTDAERGLTYTWYNISRRPQDFTSRERGYLVSRVSVTYRTATGDDIEVAYLNIQHTTKELVAEAFLSPFHWADANTGASFGFRYKTLTDAEVWAAAYTDLARKIGRPNSLKDKNTWGTYSASQAPTDPQVLAAEIAVAEKFYTKQMNGFVRWLSTPFVDYAHVDDDFDAERVAGHPGNLRGTGIGHRMYLLAAEHLATYNRVLRASDLQTDEAKALWGRLLADPTVPTRYTRVRYYEDTHEPVKPCLCIDYTRTPDKEDR